ncbi:unnamed protein product [Eruca vesicaria subsp. sativa]|uniref:Uncharacterized protein n=1 Tax=Eruca vesicaria subsp. sativa TaxID=29727 RepID=A0ABC8K1J7_ERUVS|nr:unnamed protein product [Eruca vesicaria subsp. sativa]
MWFRAVSSTYLNSCLICSITTSNDSFRQHHKGNINVRKTISKESGESGDGTKETEEEARRGDTTGEESSRGSGEKASGFGGLRLEGIVGMAEDSDGEGDISLEPGVGNKGDISGDIASGGETEKLEGASGKNEGAADMVEC